MGKKRQQRYAEENQRKLDALNNFDKIMAAEPGGDLLPLDSGEGATYNIEQDEVGIKKLKSGKSYKSMDELSVLNPLADFQESIQDYLNQNNDGEEDDEESKVNVLLVPVEGEIYKEDDSEFVTLPDNWFSGQRQATTQQTKPEVYVKEETTTSIKFNVPPDAVAPAPKANPLKELKIGYNNDDGVKIATFNDGYRTLTVDLNTLPHDGDYSNDVLPEGYTIKEIADFRLSEIMHNFYPSAVFTRDMMRLTIKDVPISSNKYFYFLESPITPNMIYAYYVSPESYQVFMDIVDDAMDHEIVKSFLRALLHMSTAPGFSFGFSNKTFMSSFSMRRQVRDSGLQYLVTLKEYGENNPGPTIAELHEGSEFFTSPFFDMVKFVDDYIDPPQEMQSEDTDILSSEEKPVKETKEPETPKIMDVAERSEVEVVSGSVDDEEPADKPEESDDLFEGVEEDKPGEAEKPPVVTAPPPPTTVTKSVVIDPNNPWTVMQQVN